MSDDGGGDGGGGDGGGGGGGEVSVLNAEGNFTDEFYGSHGEENREYLSRYKKPTDLSKANVELRKKFSKNPDSMVEIPSETSSDEVRAAWSKAHNRPETQDLYEYTLSDEHATKLGPLVDDKMAAFREFGHKKNWSQQDFADVLDFYHNNAATEVDGMEASMAEMTNQRFEEGTAVLEGQWLEGKDERTAAALAHLQKYGEIEIKGKDGEMINPLEKLFEEAPQLKQSPWLTMIMDNMAQKMGEAGRKGGGDTGALSIDGINSQITDIRAKQKVIRDANPVNFKGDAQFKDFEQKLKVLYQKKPE
jgi:hypothetical protein